jgi:hypothetical protein
LHDVASVVHHGQLTFVARFVTTWPRNFKLGVVYSLEHLAIENGGAWHKWKIFLIN